MSMAAPNDAPPPAKDLRPLSPAAQFRQDVKSMEGQFSNALPAHIPAERFARVLMTAVQRNPDLLKCNRQSLFNAVMQAAQDGLLPDGREGVLVPYKENVTWQPMVAGILKKVRNSGQLASIVARVVYAGDKYRNWIDDDGEHIEYEASDDADRSMVRLCFAMAKLKDGSIEVEPLLPKDIEKIRNVSRAKNGPAWSDWWEEMAKKSAIKRLAKRLPISSDLDDLLRRDDDLYDFKNGEAATALTANGRPKGLGHRIDAVVGAVDMTPTAERVPVEADPDTGEVVDYVAASSEGRLNGVPEGKKPVEGVTAPSTVATASPPPAAAQEGAGPASPVADPAPTEADLYLADLLATGDGRAEGGIKAVRAWLDEEVSAEDRALIPQATVNNWIKSARLVKAS